MQKNLVERLSIITEEEQLILDGQDRIQKERYTDQKEFVVDCKKLLEKGQLIEVRPHTRFVHFPRHRHNYVEMVYMCSGQTTHIINHDEKIVLHEGDILFLNQRVYHEILPADKDDIAVNFIILPEFFDRSFVMLERENVLRDFLVSALSADSSLSGYLHIEAHGIPPVENLLENMIWTLFEHPGTINTLNQTTMGLLLMNLTLFADSINRTAPGKEEENMIFTVLKYIETNYKSGTLSDISAALHQPAYTISRMLKKHTGQNFKELLGQRKLQQAAYLLLNTPLSVDSIIENIGYENSSYFYKSFRKKYNCSPAEYRAGGIL